uniref:Homeobox domain-containing protein n=1 Tax=Ditylenchus dipsaci TaxID=166011 RepID=A0A915D7H3_9BILA
MAISTFPARSGRIEFPATGAAPLRVHMFVQNFNSNIIIVNNSNGSAESVRRPLETTTTISPNNFQPQLVSVHCVAQPTVAFFNNGNLECSNESQEEHRLLVRRTTDQENNYASLEYSRETSENYDPTSYRAEKLRPDHVECLCRALENSSNVSRLASFLSNFTTDLVQHPCREQLLRAKALVLFHEQKFEDFYQLVQNNHFSSDNHPFLQHLWNEAHYTETEMMRGKKLDPVSRYRVRKKNNFPRTIWDGEGTSYCFKKSSRAILKEAYRKHETPTQLQKQNLAKTTGLSVIQVSNWFKNQRQRARQNRRSCRSSSSMPSSSDGAESEQEEEEDDSQSDVHYSVNEGHTEELKKKSTRSRKRAVPDTNSNFYQSSASEVDNSEVCEAANTAAAVYSAAAAQLRIYYGGQPQSTTTSQPFFYPQSQIQMCTDNYQQPSINVTMNLFNPPDNSGSIFAVQNPASEFSLKYQSL